LRSRYEKTPFSGKLTSSTLRGEGVLKALNSLGRERIHTAVSGRFGFPDGAAADVYVVNASTLAVIESNGPYHWGQPQNLSAITALGMQSDGTIVGYPVRQRPDVEEHRIRALTTIAVEGNRVDGVIEALRGEPAVSALHSTNGRWDIVAELRADSLEAFDRVLGRLRQLEGVSRTETSLLLSTFKL
jgi:DNA-binding Lrp family transcriptional regulator